jgi:transcriptional regulator with XRE-family HTH domain
MLQTIDSFYDSFELNEKQNRSDWSQRMRDRFNELNRIHGKNYIMQKDIAHALGVSKVAVTHYMQGRKQPGCTERWKILAKCLETTPEYLQYGVKSIF